MASSPEITPGVVTFIFTDNATGCLSNESEPLVVIDIPDATITGPSSICVGDITSILPATGGVWASSDISVATITNDGTITAISSGNVSFTFTDNTTGCTSEPSEEVTISNPNEASISGPSGLCIGETTVLTSAISGTWESSDESILIVNSLGEVTAIAPGIATISLLAGSACVVDPTIDIIVDAGPNPIYIGPELICLGETTSLRSDNRRNVEQ